MAPLACLGCAVILQVTTAPAPLAIGRAVESALEASNPVVEIEKLRREHPGDVYRGKLLGLRVPDAGPYTIEVRSYLFDPYLDLVDAAGHILAADDQSETGPCARLVLELQAGQDYVVRVCGEDGEPGAFTIEVRSGRPPDLSAEQQQAALVAECGRAVALREQAFGSSHERVASALNDLGPALIAQARYEEARVVLERALRIDEEYLGPDHAHTGSVWNNLGVALVQLGRYDDALAVLQAALANQDQRLGEHPDTATTLHNIGFVLLLLQRAAEARLHLERALELREKLLGEWDSTTIHSRRVLGQLLRDLGEFEAARGIYVRALDACNRLTGPDRNGVLCTVLTALGRVEEDLGFLERSRDLQEQAVRAAEAHHGQRHPGTAVVRIHLAHVLCRLGLLEDARVAAQQSVTDLAAATVPDNVYLAWALEVEADILAESGQRDAARVLCERALSIREKVLGPHHPHTATALNNLACILDSIGEEERALELQKRAYEIHREACGEVHPETLKFLANSCSGSAAAELETVLRRCEQVLGPGHETTLFAVHKLAVSLLIAGELRRARELCTRAYEGLRLSSWVRCRDSLANLVVVEAATGNTRAAWERARELVSGDLEHLHAQLWLAGEQQRFRYAAEVEEDLNTLLSCAAPLGETAADPTYETFTAWKGVVFRSMSHTIERLKSGMSQAQIEQLGRLRGVQSRLAQLAYASDVADPAAHAAALDAKHDELARLEAELAHSLHLPADAHRIAPASLAAALPARSAFVDFFVHRPRRFPHVAEGKAEGELDWQPERLLAWVITPAAARVRRVDLGEASAARDAVAAFVDALAAERGLRPDDKPDTSANDRLRALLWSPLDALLGDVDLLFVAPDSFLGRLPLETLQLDDGRFLIERTACVYVQDAAMLAALLRDARPRHEAPELLALGGVDYDARDAAGATDAGAADASWRDGFAQHWLPLSQTRAEVEGIVHYHETVFGARADRMLLTGSAATEDAFVREAARARIVHLATHGFFEPAGLPSLWEAARTSVAGAGPSLEPRKVPLPGFPPALLSGLTLAGANARRTAASSDGLLTAAEAAWLPLQSCELVVLSACETGLGQARPGEGMLSLRRALQQAGARTVISSLWRVRDDTTARLMLELYRRLWETRAPVLVALRGAQLALLEENRRRHGHALPATWGAFVVAGDWR